MSPRATGESVVRRGPGKCVHPQTSKIGGFGYNFHVNPYQATPKSPYHLSVGAIVYREDGQFLVHHFMKPVRGFTDYYHLMNESVDPKETPEQALHRGLMEEFGIVAKIIAFLGSDQFEFDQDKFHWFKTTLYFLVKYSGEHSSGRNGPDEESFSNLEWHDGDFLIGRMKEQHTRIRADFDQSPAIVRAKRYLVGNHRHFANHPSASWC